MIPIGGLSGAAHFRDSVGIFVGDDSDGPEVNPWDVRHRR